MVQEQAHWSDSDSEMELGWVPNTSQHPTPNDNLPSSEDNSSSDSDIDNAVEQSSSSEDAVEQPQVLRPRRDRHPPEWHNDYDMSQGDES